MVKLLVIFLVAHQLYDSDGSNSNSRHGLSAHVGTGKSSPALPTSPPLILASLTTSCDCAAYHTGRAAERVSALFSSERRDLRI